MKGDKLIFFQVKNLKDYVVGINCTQGYIVTVCNLCSGSTIKHEVISPLKSLGHTLEQEVEKSVKWYRENNYEECSEAWFQTKRLNVLGVVKSDICEAILLQTSL